MFKRGNLYSKNRLYVGDTARKNIRSTISRVYRHVSLLVVLRLVIYLGLFTIGLTPTPTPPTPPTPTPTPTPTPPPTSGPVTDSAPAPVTGSAP